MEIQDVLIGDNAVLVETDNDSFRFDRTDDGRIKQDPEDVPDAVLKALQDRGLTVTSFPKTIKRYVHDEATPHERSEIASKLGLSEDDGVVQRVAGISYEIELTIRVEDEDTALLTHVDGHKLEEPKTV